MANPKYLVPMSSPEIDDSDRQAVQEVLQTTSLSIGPRVVAFEQAICAYSGAQHGIAVSSGTSGLHLCIRAAGIQPGDMVITTPFSFVSSTNVILFEQAIPVFVDVDPKSGNIDVEKLAEAAADLSSADEKRMRKWLPRTGAEKPGKLRAILAVDVFGQPADFDAIRKIADQYNLILIEDSCEALGAEYKGRKAGLMGDYGVFAFYPNKQITTGEGGIIVTNDAQAADYMASLRNQGRAQGDTWLQHTNLGYNYRMDEMSAALGLSQMKRIDNLIEKRNQVAQYYNQRLAAVNGIELPYVGPDTTRMSWFVYVIRVSPKIDRDHFAAALDEAGIPVRPYFIPIHLQPYLAEKFGYRAGDYPITEDLGRRGLALPFSGVMTEEQVDLVCRILAECAENG
ncbi:DegT/DnrJ/EryC1/StrS family aminotransferase [Pelolinea submarina]|uniref:dTDP-4-amino-4,6-dideoxygalactose transaminase n=1 Tax=Pelolinea submarina TaxID=913107 RepID=A0A347ZRF8_9CHLR|nr:DegT/DnrJ/EryC1/StrS family aminotransferase [Pelolinea submarina]REG11556.1 dTDP-4-amino-4,6-dideoxygalactose transaminase [Pelolinea submarina]BBB47889.1 perosamine synthetase [Pelolinea submarina]